MELELDFAKPVGYVFAVNTADVDGPLMGVLGVDVRRAVGGIEGFSDAAVDYAPSESLRCWLEDRRAYRKVYR